MFSAVTRAGERAVLGVEELIVGRLERAVRSKEAVEPDDGVLPAKADVEAALGQHRDVGRHVQVAEVVAELVVADRVPDATLRLANRGVVAREVAHQEPEVETIPMRGLLHHEADLVQQGRVAEAILAGLDGEQAGRGARRGVGAFHPPEEPYADLVQRVADAQRIDGELHLGHRRGAQRGGGELGAGLLGNLSRQGRRLQTDRALRPRRQRHGSKRRHGERDTSHNLTNQGHGALS